MHKITDVDDYLLNLEVARVLFAYLATNGVEKFVGLRSRLPYVTDEYVSIWFDELARVEGS